MEPERHAEPSDLGIVELIDTMWAGKFIIAAFTVVSLLLGLVLYLFLPRSYQSEVEITPLRHSQFVTYEPLVAEDVFPYTLEIFETQYATYVRNFDNLAAKAKKTGVVQQGDLSEQAYDVAIRKFIESIAFEVPPPAVGTPQHFLRMTARGGNVETLSNFMTSVLMDSSQEMAQDLADEVRQQAAIIKDKQLAEIAMLNADIAARRERFEAARHDQVAKLAEQAAIARSLNIEKPLELRALDAAEVGRGSMQINSAAVSEPYLRGYAALNEQMNIIRSREDNDPFIDDLREQQQRIYTLQNSPRSERILSLLSGTPLADPSTAVVARYSLASVIPDKVFPRLSVFAPLFLFLGLLLGTGFRPAAQHPT